MVQHIESVDAVTGQDFALYKFISRVKGKNDCNTLCQERG
jgi:hypothetical protein